MKTSSSLVVVCLLGSVLSAAATAATCTLPTIVNAPTTSCVHTHQASIQSGEWCDTVCNTGFTAHPSRLVCGTGGTFTPSAFTCEANCIAPSVTNAPTASCVHGGQTGATASGQTCTTVCSSGYTAHPALLFCNNGAYTPSTFTCQQACTPPTVSNAPASAGASCERSGHAGLTASGGFCLAMCNAGFTPSPLGLTCHNGAYTPSTFTCNADCTPPTVTNAPGSLGSCEQRPGHAGLTASGQQCTTVCSSGFKPSPSRLTCHNGVYTPSTFICTQVP